MAFSPGSTMLQTDASIAALPVPETGNVTSFRVRNRSRSIRWQSSITARKSGSRCPTTWVDMALRILG